MPRLAVASVELAVAINICAAIIGIGYAVDRYTHLSDVNRHNTHLRVPGDGFWFCLAGIFGNGCWD